MNICCSRLDVLSALRALQHAIDLHSTLPLRGHILLTAEAGSIRLTATNFRLGMACRVTGTVVEAGKACVPIHPLLAYLQSCADELIVLETREMPLATDSPGTMLMVNGRLALASLDETLFPPVAFPEPACLRIRCVAARFKTLCRRASCAVAQGAAEPLLSCLWLSIQGQSLTLATTDLSRCAIQRLACAGEGSLRELLFVPARPLLLLARLLPARGEVELLIDVRRSLLCLRTAKGDFLLRLIDGQIAGSEATHKLLAPLQQERVSFLFEQLLPTYVSTLMRISTRALQSVVKKQPWPLALSVETDREEAATLVIRVYQPAGPLTHHLPVQVWGPAFQPVWLNMADLCEALSGAAGAQHLALACCGDPSRTLVLRWLKPEGSGEVVDADYSAVFKPLDRYTLSRLPHLRRQLPEPVRCWIEEQVELARHRQEALPLVQVRMDVLSRIACILHFALLPSHEEIQQGVAEVKRLNEQSDYARREACVRSDQLTHALALAAFAPGGSRLDLASPTGIRLSFDASVIQALLA